MQGYTPTLVLTGVYLLAVYVGPRLMKDRQPFHLNNALFAYNLILVAINFHICSEVCISEALIIICSLVILLSCCSLLLDI